VSSIIVSSAIANKPLNGGNAWAVLNWVLGLQKLGFDVYFIEQIASKACVDALGNPAPLEASLNLAYFRQVMGDFGLQERAALILDDESRTSGPTLEQLCELAEGAALLVNISGHLSVPSLTSRIGRKAFVDFDPGFTQFWHSLGYSGTRLENHDLYFTVGENIGTPGCAIPTAEIPWRPIRQPVVLDYCDPSARGDPNRFTTVASWRGAYGTIYYEDRTYGQKVHEFRKVLDMPRLAPQSFEIALEIYPGDHKDLEALLEHGWAITDPKQVAPTPADFARYIERSGGEFSAAQGTYVATWSGWFSDRSVRYLATGKPVLVQETGFSRNYPVGEGLLAFNDVAEAAEGAARIARDYDSHSRAARQIAEEYFDSGKVLSRFIDICGVSVSRKEQSWTFPGVEQVGR
jgi:hypothetical protein